MRADLALLLVAGLQVAAAPPVRAAAPQASPPPSLGALLDEAAARFGLPPAWLAAVIAVESGGDPRATSPAGAIGLMQIMPATYAELALRHGLGGDAYAPRDNLLAGAAYLRALVDRFGAVGAFAAYNAGPARYALALSGGRPLPAETRAYVRRIHQRLGWPEAAPTRRPAVARDPIDTVFATASERGLAPAGDTAGTPADGLFVPTGREDAP